MISLRALITLGAGAVVICACGASATARELPTTRSGILDFPKKFANSRQIAQTDSLQPLELNPNPLDFPTKPEEVKIKNELAITLKQANEIARRHNKSLETARLILARSQADLGAALAEEYPTISARVDLARNSSAQIEIQNEGIRQQRRGLREIVVNFLTQLGAPPNLIELFLQQGLSANVVEQIRQLGASETVVNLLRQLGVQLSETPEESTDFNGRIQLDYDIYTGGRRGAQIQLAEKQVRIDELGVEIAAAETIFNTTRDYYSLQNADARVGIEEGAIGDATRSLREAELLRREGLATRLDVLQAEAELSTANQRLVLAIAQQRTARRQLAETIGLGRQVEFTAADPIDLAGTWDLSLEESIVLAIKNRAELEQQLLQRDISDRQRQIELSALEPQIALFANYNFTDNFDDSATVADGYSLGGSVQWNMFDGGRAFARARRALIQKEIAEVNFAQRRDRIRLDVESAYYDLNANRENIQTARKNEERATERLRLARLRFQAGVGTQTDVIDAQRDLTEAKGNYLQAIVGYNQSLNQLQRSISNLPGNGLFEKP